MHVVVWFTFSMGVMQSAAVLWVRSRAPLMTVISSWDRLPPSPSFRPCASTRAFNWALLNRACHIAMSGTVHSSAAVCKLDIATVFCGKLTAFSYALNCSLAANLYDLP